MAAPDLQANYGGRRLDAGAGVNLVATGVQLPQTDSLQLNLSRAF